MFRRLTRQKLSNLNPTTFFFVRKIPRFFFLFLLSALVMSVKLLSYELLARIHFYILIVFRVFSFVVSFKSVIVEG